MENYQLLLQPLNKIRAIPIVTCVSSYLFVLLFKFAGSPYLVTSIAAARAELLIAIVYVVLQCLTVVMRWGSFSYFTKAAGETSPIHLRSGIFYERDQKHTDLLV